MNLEAQTVATRRRDIRIEPRFDLNRLREVRAARIASDNLRRSDRARQDDVAHRQ